MLRDIREDCQFLADSWLLVLVSNQYESLPEFVQRCCPSDGRGGVLIELACQFELRVSLRSDIVVQPYTILLPWTVQTGGAICASGIGLCLCCRYISFPLKLPRYGVDDMRKRILGLGLLALPLFVSAQINEQLADMNDTIEMVRSVAALERKAVITRALQLTGEETRLAVW